MNIVRLVVAFILVQIATAVMSYISMATPVGPWIETTLVLIGMLIFAIIFPKCNSQYYITSLGLITAAGGIAGILATACGFTIPTLYFIAPEIFKQWLADPTYFGLYLLLLALAAGSLGLVFAQFFEQYLIVDQNMSFAVGDLVYKLISAQDRMKKACSLAIGFISTFIILYVQRCLRIIPSEIVLIGKKISWGIFCLPKLALPFEQLPMFWSIGFVAGHVIAKPLLMGLIAKALCLDSLYVIYNMLFPHKALSVYDFTIAFGGGMVFYVAIMGFIRLTKDLYHIFKKYNYPTEYGVAYIQRFRFFVRVCNPLLCIQMVIACIANGVFFWYFDFSFMALWYVLITTGISIYQLLVIAGRMGIAPIGRFATFVLVPGMFLFGFNPIQITLVSAFVEIAGGVACDALFGRKMALLANIDRKHVVIYQWLGLIVSALVIGIIFWILLKTFCLGNQSHALGVTKAASRALLISVKEFNLIALIAGILFGCLLSFTRVNSLLVLGGILMAPQNSIMLIAGGLSASMVADRERYYPLWSGIFAANSLWILLRAFIKIC